RATVANLVRLLKLPKPVQDYLAAGEIEAGHAKVLLGLEDQSRMKAVCELVVKRGMSVRELEAMLRKSSKASGRAGKTATPEMRSIEQKLKHFFGTKVSVKGNYKKGKIEVEYYSAEDLERILEALDIKP
ncbi:MAG TPA: chromosome partitioning protein ParB, partial [Candidatus Goldiibacteriota bacterium]|nr:chromosome partitioning protein ParB [Candidatus Goldiibacteriota bacterium]